MFGFVDFMWPLIAGICLYAGCMHLQIGLRQPIDRVHTVFGVLALCMAFGTFGNIWLTSAASASSYQAAAWYASVTATLVYIVLPWFIAYYADEPKQRGGILLSGFFVLVLLGNFLHPHSMLLSGPPALRTVTLPWGEQITRASTAPTSWFNLMWVGYFLTVAYIGYACARVFRLGPRSRAWGLALSAGPFGLSLCINFAGRMGWINLPGVAALGFMAFIAVMSLALTREWRRVHLQMQTVLDNVPAVVYLKRPDGRYVFVNRHYERLYGLPAAQVLGKSDAQLLPADQVEQNFAADRQALAGEVVESETGIEVDGTRRIYASVRFALRDSGNVPYALCGISTDITERKTAADALKYLATNLERRVARRTSELARVNDELEAFAYSVSHDLRAPLTAVNGFAELLLREHGNRLDHNGQRYLQRIRDASLRMAALIQDLLGLSRVSQQSLGRTTIDLAQLAAETVKGLRESEPSRQVIVELPERLPAQGDANLLGLVLNNLLSNAWKYTAKAANARIEFGSLERDGEQVFFVKDNGAGFDPTHADRLFRPFVRLHSEQEFHGTGIGLATVARIVTRHGGRIWAEGSVGLGATFYFTLPTPEEELAVEKKVG